MRSMTGFGQAKGDNGRYGVAVSVRSVNGRFLDLAVRLREEHRGSEPLIRDLVAAVVQRGRVEMSVEIRPVAGGTVRVELRENVVRSLRQAASRLVAEGLLRPDLTLGDLLRTPEVIELRVGESEWSEADAELLATVVRAALTELAAARAREGGQLAAVLGERLGGLEALVAELDPLVGMVQQEAVAALRRRLQHLLGEQPVDEQRLAQEAAILADRSDVSEELDRLRGHLVHFRALLVEEGALGKRLDFLVQEIFRELNTLGSKSRHGEVTRRVLDAKVLGEQLREQVQNIE